MYRAAACTWARDTVGSPQIVKSQGRGGGGGGGDGIGGGITGVGISTQFTIMGEEQPQQGEGAAIFCCNICLPSSSSSQVSQAVIKYTNDTYYFFFFFLSSHETLTLELDLNLTDVSGCTLYTLSARSCTPYKTSATVLTDTCSLKCHQVKCPQVLWFSFAFFSYYTLHLM